MLVIKSIVPGSPAERLGLVPGDALVAIGGRAASDAIDVAFYATDSVVDLVFRPGADGPDRTMRSVVVGPEGLGVEFTQPTADGIRTCNNHCIFCFIDQSPGGMRRALYVKDDDYRYSFLAANFITLTNLTEADWHKIEEQRLSPLYVSVHASDLALRRRLLGNPRAPDILGQLDRLSRVGIRVHTQIVLCPGFNDGEALEQTVRDLAARWPSVLSIAIVPVGLTRQRFERQGRVARKRPDVARLRLVTPPEARTLVRWARARQREFERTLGHPFLYLSDELYLLAGRRVPAALRYGDFAQLENGVGMIRVLLDDWRRARPLLPPALPSPVRAVIACASLVAPTFQQIAQEMHQVGKLCAQVAVVENRFFGPSVTVSGLLTGQDILDAVGDLAPDDLLVVPRVALDFEGAAFLDGMSLEEFRRQTAARVAVAGSMAQVVEAIVAQDSGTRRQVLAAGVA